MTVALRLLKEFWIPALVAIGWTAFALHGSNEIWTFKAAVANFGPAFFLASWATGQLFRVKKQADVESKLAQIESRAESLLQKLDGHVRDFAGHIYGAPSGVHLVPRVASTRLLELALVNPSPYPVVDFFADLSIHRVARDSVVAEPTITQTLSPGLIFPRAEQPTMTNVELQSERTGVVARISTRTHAASQLFVVHRIGDDVEVAYRTFVEGVLLNEDCSNEALRNDLEALEAYARRAAQG